MKAPSGMLMAAMLRLFTPCAVALVAACPAAAQQWTAVRLHPESAHFSEVYAIGPGQQGGYLRDLATLRSLAVIWNGTSTGWTTLGSGAAAVFGMSDGVQVGHISGRAVLWQGTSQSRVDRHPPNAFRSRALAVAGDMQVGCTSTGESRAALWYGTAASHVNLHPANAVRSFAYATDGVLQGGVVVMHLGGFERTRAALWSGSAESFVDLTPIERPSDVQGMAPGVQVGEVDFGAIGQHAALWRGTRESWVNMHPPG